MPLPAALMIGGGLLSGIGMIGQARAGRRAARRMDRLASGVQGQYDAALAPIGGLLAELEGQNLGQMGLEQARMAGYGFDRGAKEAEFARRTGGLNSYAAIMGTEQIRQQAALGQAALGATANLRQQNLAARMGLTETMAQGQMRAADMANQIRLGGIQQRQQSTQQGFGALTQLGGFALGAGIQGYMAPQTMTTTTPTFAPGPEIAQSLGVDYGTLASRFRLPS
jgi:hypothetical protein